MLVVVLPSVRRRDIVRQHNSPAIPQAEPRELEPPNMSCAALAVISATGQLWQGREQLRVCPSRDDVGGVQHFNPMHPACVSCHFRALPCQPFHVALELQESSRMENLRLGGCRDIDPWEFALHTRSPLVSSLNQSIKVWEGHPLPRPRKKKQ